MSRGTHLHRRGAVYIWQRRVPKSAFAGLSISHIRLNLETKDIAVARRLVAPLDAKAMEVFTMNPPQVMTQTQLSELFKNVLREHQAKLQLLADFSRARTTVPREVLSREEKAQGEAYRIAAMHGVGAKVDASQRLRLMSAGYDDHFINEVHVSLELLGGQTGTIATSKKHIVDHVEATGAKPTSVNMVSAQPIYLRALAEALMRADDRYGDEPISNLDFDALVAETLSPEPRRAFVAEPLAVGPAKQVPAEMSSSAVSIAAAREPDAPSNIPELTETFVRRQLQDEHWDEKTARQARFIFALFARFMLEEVGITDLVTVRQSHLVRFDDFLRGLHSNFGKSTQDPTRTIKEIQALAQLHVPEKGALQGATRNRHMTFLGQLIAFAKGRGSALDRDLSTTPFRARKNQRARDERPVPKLQDVTRLFHRPIFTGYAGWDDIDTPGDEFFHRAEYFCSILASYQGARREEYCGLSVDDVVIDNGPHPYLHIAASKIRRIKNKQSRRNLALHPEVIRLGFLNYVTAIKALGYSRLFPDLYSPSTRRLLGDRLYDQMLPSFKAVGFTSHHIRHFFGDGLKQEEVHEEFRADLLGHGGDSETTERYCNPLRIERQLVHLAKLPVVTAHLEPKPIRLVPWVAAKQIAPWSRAARKVRAAR
jgi:integrase